MRERNILGLIDRPLRQIPAETPGRSTTAIMERPAASMMNVPAKAEKKAKKAGKKAAKKAVKKTVKKTAAKSKKGSKAKGKKAGRKR